MEALDVRAAYGELCRPRNVRLMRALGLDVVYERAYADQLFFRGEDGAVIAVTDLVGGYGSTFFGHHHPAIVRAASSALESELPFAAQVSVRAKTAELARRLNEVLRERLGEDFAVLLASTGAEAVEIALKHSEMRFRSRFDALRQKLDRALSGIERSIREGKSRLHGETARTLGIDPGAAAELTSAVRARFDAAIARISPAIIALERGFHGKTVGALSLTHFADYREPFARLLSPVWFVGASDVRSLERVVSGHQIELPWPVVDEHGNVTLEVRTASGVVAMFVEPMQGEGGVRPVSVELLARARELADEHRFALVFDEIQCGMGRTGTFLFSEQLGVTADAYLLSKSLGGGLAKISACLLRRDQLEERFPMIHTSTFAEDDPSSHVALASLSLVLEKQPIEPMERAKRVGGALKSALSRVAEKYRDVVREVRGAGLMLGIELEGAEAYPSGAIRAVADQGLLGYAVCAHLLHDHRLRVMPCISSPRVLRLEPSAYLAEVSIGRVALAFERVCAILRAGDAHALFAHLVLARSHERSIAIAREKREPTTRASCERRVGFIGYFVDAEQMPKFDPSLARFSTFAREELVRKTFGAIEPAHSGSAIVRSIDGSEVELRYYGLFVDSRTFYENLRGEGREVLRAQIERAARMAREDGCTVVGFGGLTSVVTANCRDIAVEGVALTTGNSLTVAMCIEAARREALAMGIDLSESTIAAVGAGGNIGSVYSLRMSDEAARMVLVARAGHEASLEALRCAIYERAYGRLLEASDETGALSDDAPLRRGVSRALHRFEGVRELLTRRIAARGGEIAEIVKSAPPVEVTSDLRALRDASLVLGASNAPHALIKREHLGEGPVLVVDVAVPGDADSSVAALAPRVKVISGGAVDLGIANASLVPQAPLPRGHLYACAAETIVLGLEGRRESFSVGAIDLAQVEEILALATKHGFGLSNEAHVSALAPLKASA